jgi:hypothetical protein
MTGVTGHQQEGAAGVYNVYCGSVSHKTRQTLRRAEDHDAKSGSWDTGSHVRYKEEDNVQVTLSDVILVLLLLLLSTGAYSPGRTFGLPFRGFVITHRHTR